MADTREQFEAWMVGEAKIMVGSSDPYPAGLERDYWRVWQAALASRPAEVDDEGLPPLPPEVARAMKGEVAFFVKWQDAGKELRGSLMLYTAEQFRQGQRDAVAADRARREVKS